MTQVNELNEADLDRLFDVRLNDIKRYAKELGVHPDLLVDFVHVGAMAAQLLTGAKSGPEAAKLISSVRR